jgi:polyhydroxyalkanoate synthesis regulator protein
MYLIKRYKNRRVYDMIKRKYLNLRKVMALIKAGKGIKVVDKNSGKDITQKVLKKSFLQTGSISSLVRESFCAGLEALLH